jgi:hypothetical protein
VARVPKPTLKIDNRLSALPDRNGGAEFAKAFEIFLKKRRKLRAKLVRVQLHSPTL